MIKMHVNGVKRVQVCVCLLATAVLFHFAEIDQFRLSSLSKQNFENSLENVY